MPSDVLIRWDGFHHAESRTEWISGDVDAQAKPPALSVGVLGRERRTGGEDSTDAEAGDHSPDHQLLSRGSGPLQ